MTIWNSFLCSTLLCQQVFLDFSSGRLDTALNVDHFASTGGYLPFPSNTIGIVRKQILKSSKSDQVSIN